MKLAFSQQIVVVLPFLQWKGWICTNRIQGRNSTKCAHTKRLVGKYVLQRDSILKKDKKASL
jgi:hypothetical protein